MILKPDLSSTCLDPFSATPMLILFCDVGRSGDRGALRPRPALHREARRAYLQSTGIGDTVYVGPEPNSSCSTMCGSRTATTPPTSGSTTSSCRPIPAGPMKAATLPTAPRQGRLFSGRTGRQRRRHPREMVSTMIEMGLPMDKHHHEVAAAQHELGLTYGSLVETADRMQIYKYVVHMVAQAYGKTATFMPKPIKGDNGSACTSTCRSGRAAIRCSPATVMRA
jgi:glutamine synthetase